jgi:transposase InsO family protein
VEAAPVAEELTVKRAIEIGGLSRTSYPQTIGREERFHGSLKLELVYRVLPNDRTELIDAVKS